MSAVVQPDGTLARVVNALASRLGRVEAGQLRLIRAPIRFQGVDGTECVVNVEDGKIQGCFTVTAPARTTVAERGVAPFPAWHFTDGNPGTVLAEATSDSWLAPWSCFLAGVAVTAGAGAGASEFTIHGREGDRPFTLAASATTFLLPFTAELIVPEGTAVTLECSTSGGHTGVVVQPFGYLNLGVA